MRTGLSSIALILWVAVCCHAQYSFNRSLNPIVSDGTGVLQNPWGGGLNFGQFSKIDLNFDGTDDLIIFDKSGNRILPFLAEPGSIGLDYEYAPQYIQRFPKLTGWVLAIDYNCDSQADLFTQTAGGIYVYRNSSGATGRLTFEPAIADDRLLSRIDSVVGPIVVNATDIPAIADIDFDGDLDILTFDPFGSLVEWHQNLSMEEQSNCDGLSFQLADACWGNFSESFSSNLVDLGISCKSGSSMLSNSANGRHSGSTVTAIDLDGDQDMELLLGDLSFPNLVMLHNDGDAQLANMTAVDPDFPSYNVPANLFIFPAAFHLDLDNDGFKDLVVSAVGQNVSENLNNSWFYRNTGNTDSVEFALESRRVINETMLDFGEGAYPIAYDYNFDGLTDLLVGNYGYFRSQGNYQAQLALFENTGSLTAPTFELVSLNWQGLAADIDRHSFIPTLGDIDGDGDADMISGEIDGKLLFFENQTNDPLDHDFVLVNNNFQSIDVGEFAAPFLVDVNGDQLLDLVIGERNGNLNYYENRGTATQAQFSLITGNWGKVNVAQSLASQGFSVPNLYRSASGLELFVGSENGQVFHFNLISASAVDSFPLVNSYQLGVPDGARSAVTVNDWNDDGLVDLIAGNYSGGLHFFTGVPYTDVSEIDDPEFQVSLFPNPVNSFVIFGGTRSDLKFDYRIFSLSGSEVRNGTIGSNQTLNLGSLAEGQYFVQLSTENRKTYLRFVKVN